MVDLTAGSDRPKTPWAGTAQQDLAGAPESKEVVSATMGGVFISEGMQLRIPSGGLRLRMDDRGDLESAVEVEVSLEVWPFWLDVAIDHAVTARGARNELVGAVEREGEEALDDSVKAELLARECSAGMVAISASAFALDNFYAAIQTRSPNGAELEAKFEAAGTARHRRVSETIRRTFRTPNARAKQLHGSVQQVFLYRDWAVHPPADFRKPIEHDYLDVGVEWRFVAFRASNAITATRAATRIIDQSVGAPRPSHEAIVTWCAAQKPRSEQRSERVQRELPSADDEIGEPAGTENLS